MEFALSILGVSGAVPAHGRFPTAQVLQVCNNHYLIDCGEGTQMRMSQYKIPRNRINEIFISHLHGDHIFGLPGLLFSYALNGRTKPIDIFSPTGLKAMILAQLTPGAQLPFQLRFHELNTKVDEMIFQNSEITVTSFPLDHRIPTCGFLFREKVAPLNIIPEKIQQYNLGFDEIRAVKAGEDLLKGNVKLSNKELTFPPYKRRSFAYASDTAYHPKITDSIKDVDILYHESTFCECDQDHATATKHSTAKQAATIAKNAGAKTLILGHFSSRYTDLSCFEEEATSIFQNTIIGKEGGVYKVERQRDVN